MIRPPRPDERPRGGVARRTGRPPRRWRASTAVRRVASRPASWQWPLRPPPPRVVRGFAPPAHPWEAGHRGVDLAARAGQSVYAAGAGRVGFARDLAGRGVVTIVHGALRTTYLPVRPTVRAGETVTAGARIGVVENILGHCGQSPCLHWGLRQGVTYLDPLSLLGQGPTRLLPWWDVDDPAARPRDATAPPAVTRPGGRSPARPGADLTVRPVAAAGRSGDRSALPVLPVLMAALLIALSRAWRSGARMRLPVRLAEAFGRHMRVQLRRGQRRVPEDLLHAPQVGATFEEVRRRTVP
jgi:hypothetical protein